MSGDPDGTLWVASAASQTPKHRSQLPQILMEVTPCTTDSFLPPGNKTSPSYFTIFLAMAGCCSQAVETSDHGCSKSTNERDSRKTKYNSGT
jgi:hypothetical protein